MIINGSVDGLNLLHTGNLEVLHALLLKYCPKRIQFDKNGMICRTQLAVLHFNEAMKCEQAVTKDGTPRFKLQMSKINTAPERRYTLQLMVEAKSMIHRPFFHKPAIPNLPAIYELPDKQEIITNKYTCFSL